MSSTNDKSSVDFQNEINTLCNVVDLDKGISLFNLLNEKETKTKEDLIKVSKIAGIDFVQKIIEDNLGNYADNIFVEYSILASTLDPNQLGKLICFSYIQSSESNFRSLIERNYTACIAKTKKECGISVYQHPNFLFDINQEQKYVHTVLDSMKDDDVRKFKDGIVPDNSKYFGPITGAKSDYFIQTFPLDRPYEHLISDAQAFYKKETEEPSAWYSLEELHQHLHKACYANVTKREAAHGKSHYISFPVIGSVASNQLHRYIVGSKADPLQGVGACFIYFEPKDNDGKIDEAIIQKIVYEMGHVIRFYSSNYLFNMGLKLQDHARQEAIKSAKAAIMSRNMSHNLGSHVMYYIKQQLHSVNKIMGGDVLLDLYPRPTEDDKTKICDIVTKNDLEMPFLVGLGRFINYLQERQDYIATIATDYIPANSTISFKDFIYDELKPDLRYERHKARGSSTTETNGRQPKNLLMDYIAFSEGYDSSKKIKLRFRDFTGDNPKLLDDGVTIDYSTEEGKSFKKLRDFNIAVPGGVIGRQAFFSILENMIRNAAKHSRKRTDGCLSIDFDVIEQSEINSLQTSDVYLRWWEGLRASKSQYPGATSESLAELYKQNSNKYIYLTITNNMPNSLSSFDNLVGDKCDGYVGLSGKYIDDQGNMLDEYKGLKEIRISAAWLRGYSIDTDIPANEPPAVSARLVPVDDGSLPKKTVSQFTKSQMKDAEVNDSYAIQYLICLPRPRTLAVLVTPDFELGADLMATNNIIAQFGCKIIIVANKSPETGKYYLSSEEIDKEKVTDFDLIICEKNIDNVQENVASRILYIDKDSIDGVKSVISAFVTSSEDESHYQNAIGKAYELWFKQKFSNYLPTQLSVMDGKVLAEERENLYVSGHGDLTSIDANHYAAAVVFSTHYLGQIETKDSTAKQLLSKAAFVEGITGNNSTDRLIRQDEKTDEWLYKHLAYGHTKVAIFDERIYSSIAPKSTLRSSRLVEIEQAIEKFYNLSDPSDGIDYIQDSLQDALKCISDIKDAKIRMKISADLSIKVESLGLTKDTHANRNKLRELIESACRNINGYKKMQRYHEMRIWVYNILLNTENQIDIIGYNAPIRKQVGFYDNYQVDVIGSIRKMNDEYIISLNIEHEKFDFLSVHQGILDKIYSHFGIKNNRYEKLKLTYALYKALSSQYKQEMDESFKLDDTLYLPQFIIHSGRSKPNYIDMPQKQPFIQFAAIDHAVRDCKYTLSDLLYSAHYENSNNHNSR